MEWLVRDIRYSIRTLMRDKGFAATTILTLSVCLAINSAIFAIVNSVLLCPLPVPEANSILLMANQYPGAGVTESHNSSAGDYYDRLREVPAFQQQAMFRMEDQTLTIDGRAERVPGMTATPSLFRLLRTQPLLGRTFSDEEGEIGANQKAILSYGLWRQLFAGDRSAIGKEIRVDGRPLTVIGVLPAGFDFIDPKVRLWVPLAFTPEQKVTHHSNNWYNIGRLKPGATLEQAQAQINALNAENLERFPQFKELLINARFHTDVIPLQEMLVSGVRPVLYLLWGGAIFVLLIGALNITSLALARFGLRRTELATRLALGASRVHLFRQVLVEFGLLGLTSGVAGVAIGWSVLRALSIFGLEHLPRASEVQMTPTVALAMLGLSLLAGVLISIAPLAAISGRNLRNVLQEQTRGGSTGRRSRRARQALIVVQVGLAFSLLAGAGLLLASFRQLLKVDPGFSTSGIVTASTSLPRSRYPKPEQLRAQMNQLLPAVRQIPGVISAGATTNIPFSDAHSDSVIFAEGYVLKPGESVISPRQIAVTPGYFETMGFRLLKGRFFDDRDNETAPGAVIVDERLAQRFWPDRDPIGRRMFQPNDPKDLMKVDEHTQWLTVVGVVRSVRLDDLEGNGSPVGAYYFPFAQQPERHYTLAVKAAGDLRSVSSAVRGSVTRLDPELALFDVKSMSERLELSLAARRTALLLAVAFGALALFLAAIGIYGVLAYLVAQRRREIGIRVALGSTHGRIVQLVLREGFILVALGLLLGAVASIALHSAIESQIYGVRPLDPIVLISVMLLLGSVALVACVLPARRALQVDPRIVLTEQ
jgi:predicted permease